MYVTDVNEKSLTPVNPVELRSWSLYVTLFYEKVLGRYVYTLYAITLQRKGKKFFSFADYRETYTVHQTKMLCFIV